MLPLLLLLALNLPLRATTLVRFDLEGLTANAASVLVGTCTAASPRLIEGQPYTAYRFAVGEVVKGEVGTQLEVCLPGGVHQGHRLHLAGMPDFAPGEEVVLFLTGADPKGHAWPVGLGQGKFRVDRRGAAKPRVFQDTGGSQLLGPPAESLDGMELERFLARIRRLARPEGGEGGR